VPQWPKQRDGHAWNVVFNDHGKLLLDSLVMFTGGDESPGSPHRANTYKGKVYRETYSINDSSLAMIGNGRIEIPGFLNNPRIRDVSEYYFKVYNPKIVVRENNKVDIVYLGCFDDNGWKVVQWGNKISDSVVFKKMEGNNLYWPFYYRNNQQSPANNPFILHLNGEIEFVSIDMSKTISLKVDSLFPSNNPDLYMSGLLIGGQFQGANQSDFSDAEIIHVISKRPFPGYNTVKLDNPHTFKYLRFLSAPSRYCSISEIEFYSSNRRRLYGRIIGSPGARRNDRRRVKEMAFDGKLSSGYKSKYSFGDWVGVELDTPAVVTEIKYAPIYREITNRPVNKKSYELMYWDGSSWVIQGVKKANNNSLIFNDVPKNGLYLVRLEHKPTGINRIFIYKNGKQLFY